MNINDIFDNRKADSKAANARDYDVRITLNKSGKGGFAIRFGFLNNAVDAFRGKEYIQMSDVEKMQTKIYFRLSDTKEYVTSYRLSQAKAKTESRYTAFKPSDNAEKIYRAKWIGRTFELKYDSTAKLYYIEL